jgi:hypothetical protein
MKRNESVCYTRRGIWLGRVVVGKENCVEEMGSFGVGAEPSRRYTVLAAFEKHTKEQTNPASPRCHEIRNNL